MTEQLMAFWENRWSYFTLRSFLPAIPYLAFALFLLGLWHYAAGPQWFPIQGVKVEGRFQHISRVEIKEIVSPFLAEGYFHFNSYGLKEKLLSNVWAENVVVKRVWPNRVVIQITERQPFVRWQQNGLISTDSKIFFPTQFDAKEWLQLPHLAGPEAMWKDIFMNYRQLQATAVKAGLAITDIVVSDRLSYEVKLAPALYVKLGREQVLPRFSRFLQAYQQLPLSTREHLSTVDMRYPDGMAIREAVVSMSLEK